MKVAVIGLGKAGLPLACVIADSGLEVIGVDISETRVKELNNKINPIPEEDGLSEMLNKHIGNNLTATTSFEKAAQECNVFIVIVPLFIDENKKPVFKNIDTVMNKLSSNLKENDLVVLETTVPVGTTKNRLKPILDKAEVNYHLAYSPERIMTGKSISRYKEFPKVIGGVDTASTDKAHEIYSKFCTQVKKVKDSKTAEFVKVSEGVYRDVNIALANELFKLCDKYDIDFNELRGSYLCS